MATTILRLREVLRLCGKSRSAHYNDIKAGLFPKPVKLGLRSAGYPDDEVAAINAARIAGMDANGLRELVASLEQRRKSAG